MAINSINTNLAAYAATSNIGRASDMVTKAVARLSSGERIVNASDDVAALAAGTLLTTTVSTLRTALLNTAQGSSLLQVADGGLSQINDILARQKAIAVQATSGSLSDTERGFLNLEFQSLVSEIDRLVTSTKFNQVTLLNGSLSGAKAITTDVQDSTNTAGASAGAVVTIAGAVANGDKLNVAGLEIEFTTSTVGTTGAAGKVVVGASVTETAANLVRFLNSSNDPRFANLVFTYAAGAVSANWAGGLLNGAYVVSASSVTGTNFTIGSAANRTIAVTNPADGLGVDRTQALGETTGSLLVNGATAATGAGQALDLRSVEDNQNFTGKFGGTNIGKITGLYTGVADTVVLSVKVGDITYSTTATDVSNAAVTTLTFTGSDAFGTAKGGSFTLTLQGAAIAANAITGQGDLDPIVNQLNDSLAGITVVQNRDITSFQEGEIVSLAGVQIANLNGISVNLQSDDFTSAQIESISVKAPAQGSTDATFSVVINGETYVSTSGVGNQIATNTQISLQSLTNPNRTLSIITGNTGITGATTVALDIGTQAKADAIQKELEDAFGLTGAGAKLNFQVGNAASDTIGVQIINVSTTSLYQGKTLSIATAVGAATAASTIDTAINTLTAVRANVGALQSRFNFASATVESSIQNLDAARSSLLDTDIASESTVYANSQVKLQAGISVLAQANQQLQNLLKLIS